MPMYCMQWCYVPVTRPGDITDVFVIQRAGSKVHFVGSSENDSKVSLVMQSRESKRYFLR